MKRVFVTTLACAIVLTAQVLARAAAPAIKSQSLTTVMRVDGRINDWATLTSLTKEVTVAAANDPDRLLIAVATSDPKVRQRIQIAGLIVYLDAKGKKGESFGVRVPPLGGAMMGRGRPGGPPDGGPLAPGAAPPPGGGERSPGANYIEVIGPENNERHIVDLIDSKGFAVASGENAGTLLVELGIPLRAADNHPYAVQIADLKSPIGIGLVTPAVPRAGQGSGGPGGISIGGGRGGGRGGGMGGMGGGGMRGGGADIEGKSIKIWTTIALAKD